MSLHVAQKCQQEIEPKGNMGSSFRRIWNKMEAAAPDKAGSSVLWFMPKSLCVQCLLSLLMPQDDKAQSNVL